mmetsp:Transcript_49648/g.118213  ORF Transcript_49648/g.118213 Transcript_49648/m.118213 type:complete len:374 (+) Transcript_49648:1282-2403(+)
MSCVAGASSAGSGICVSSANVAETPLPGLSAMVRSAADGGVRSWPNLPGVTPCPCGDSKRSTARGLGGAGLKARSPVGVKASGAMDAQLGEKMSFVRSPLEFTLGVEALHARLLRGGNGVAGSESRGSENPHTMRGSGVAILIGVGSVLSDGGLFPLPRTCATGVATSLGLLHAAPLAAESGSTSCRVCEQLPSSAFVAAASSWSPLDSGSTGVSLHPSVAAAGWESAPGSAAAACGSFSSLPSCSALLGKKARRPRVAGGSGSLPGSATELLPSRWCDPSSGGAGAAAALTSSARGGSKSISVAMTSSGLWPGAPLSCGIATAAASLSPWLAVGGCASLITPAAGTGSESTSSGRDGGETSAPGPSSAAASS